MNLFQRFLRLFGVELRYLGETRLEGSEAQPAPAAPLATTPAATPVPAATAATAAPAPNAPVAQDTRTAAPGGGTIAIPVQTAPFVNADLLQRLPLMKPAELDLFDFGCVKVSDQGLVEIYNKWESDFAGVPKDAALGRNFFRELAPCTNNRLIFGRFKEGVESGELNTLVSYAFTYKMKPTLVRVHLYRDPATKTNWVLVQKHEARPGK